MKLLIQHELAAREEIEYCDGGRTLKYENHGRFVGYKPNPSAWTLGPYEKYLTIDVEMRLYGPSVVTIKREVCQVATHDAGTYDETYIWRVMRHTTRHYLTGDELGTAWPEIEQRKQEGAELTVYNPPVSIDPYRVVNYVGI